MAFVCFVLLFQMLFSGSQQCFENYQTTKFYGINGISHSTCKVTQQNLIPLLKSMVQMLEENSSSVSPETSGKREGKGTVGYLILFWP